MERAAVLFVWRNFVKRFSEREGGPTPAMRLGLTERPVPVEEVLGRRLFPGRTVLPGRWRLYYRREVETRRIPNGVRHRLGLAF